MTDLIWKMIKIEEVFKVFYSGFRIDYSESIKKFKNTTALKLS